LSRRKVLTGLLLAVAVAGGSFAAAAALTTSDRSDAQPHQAMHGHGGGMMAGMRVADEFEWVATMIPHHEEAIAAAEVLERGTDRPEMREFADRIITTQSREVVQLKAWLAAWYPGRDAAVDYTPMMRDLTALTGDALDRAFLQDMIPHHMGAVMMSQQLLSGDFPVHPELTPFARTIRDTQHAEIGEMSGWLAGWFGSGPMGGMPGTGGMRGMRG
jgi:uncharacterized protein (DUF305 family)